MNTPTTVTLPDAVTRYFEATNRFDAESAAASFAADATVRDEGQTLVGIDAIKNWVSHASEKYQPHATPLRTQEDGDQHLVTARVEGQFPGSPIELQFEFHLRDGKIAELAIK